MLIDGVSISFFLHLLSWFSHINSGSWGVSSLSYGVINSDVFAIDFHSCALVFGHFGIVRIFKVNEGKAS